MVLNDLCLKLQLKYSLEKRSSVFGALQKKGREDGADAVFQDGECVSMALLKAWD